jgi:SNF2 family DNA or RNA helicase
VRQEVGRQKLSVLLAGTTIDQWQAKYRRVVYWVWHKTMARLLADHLKKIGIPVDLLVGDSPTAGRKRVVAEWQHGRPDDDRALVASIGAGSVAVSLTSARAAVFVEFAWDMLSQMQAEKRHHRFGNKHDEVHAIYCVLESTLDARMLEVLLEKAQHSEGTLGEDGQVDLVREVVGDSRTGDKSWLGF